MTKSREITQADLTIAVMSGNFVQRGEPAIINKWDRAEMALKSGVDVLIELPTIYATSSAENFSYGAILALEAIKATNFVFGSESNEISKLRDIAKLSINEPDKLSTEIKKNLNDGLSFMQAKQLAYEKFYPNLSDILTEPNNILGLNYIKALSVLNSQIKPYAIKRKGANYHSLDLSSLSSASAIRMRINSLDEVKSAMPERSYTILKKNKNNRSTLQVGEIFAIISILLKRAKIEELYSLPEMEIGMPELLKKEIYLSSTFDEFINNCTSKRYSNSRIRRALIRLLLGITQTDLEESQKATSLPYLRILGLNSNKGKLIKQWKDNLEVDLIQKTSNYKPESKLSNLLWTTDLKATDLYFNLIKNDEYSLGKQDFIHPLVII